MQEITFYEQYEWSAARNAMKFWALIDGEPHICWVDEHTLNSFAQSDEEEKNVQAYFMENQLHIREMARRKILSGGFDKDRAITISTEDISPAPA